jgi:hypothetical protein
LPGLVLKIIKGEHEIIPEHYSPDLKSLIDHTVCNNIEKRFEASQIVDLTFIQPKILDIQMRIGRPNLQQ